MEAEWTHERLVERAGRWLRNTRRCKVVLAGARPWSVSEYPDAIGWMPDGVSIVVECKMSQADFTADGRKFWRKLSTGMGMYRYYLAPPDVLHQVPRQAGWLEAKGRIVVVRQEAEPRQCRDWAAEMAMLLAQVSHGREVPG